eukprot:CAMPEP_0118857814 /NCGR_PEP_ID=MMETSP1163-20130328/4748_1 /TAXON_ID=124430 /ORGANISM="Phaeomonas parva, Strain CCMP2877" /LENGTH=1081 /DNA_ID=CAMNT_0006791173 /DNA_START=339 /DNA_END=3584 /DNA_ORIENTATION=+
MPGKPGEADPKVQPRTTSVMEEALKPKADRNIKFPEEQIYVKDPKKGLWENEDAYNAALQEYLTTQMDPKMAAELFRRKVPLPPYIHEQRRKNAIGRRGDFHDVYHRNFPRRTWETSTPDGPAYRRRVANDKHNIAAIAAREKAEEEARKAEERAQLMSLGRGGGARKKRRRSTVRTEDIGCSYVAEPGQPLIPYLDDGLNRRGEPAEGPAHRRRRELNALKAKHPELHRRPRAGGKHFRSYTAGNVLDAFEARQREGYINSAEDYSKVLVERSRRKARERREEERRIAERKRQLEEARAMEEEALEPSSEHKATTMATAPKLQRKPTLFARMGTGLAGRRSAAGGGGGKRVAWKEDDDGSGGGDGDGARPMTATLRRLGTAGASMKNLFARPGTAGGGGGGGGGGEAMPTAEQLPERPSTVAHGDAHRALPKEYQKLSAAQRKKLRRKASHTVIIPPELAIKQRPQTQGNELDADQKARRPTFLAQMKSEDFRKSFKATFDEKANRVKSDAVRVSLEAARKSFKATQKGGTMMLNGVEILETGINKLNLGGVADKMELGAGAAALAVRDAQLKFEKLTAKDKSKFMLTLDQCMDAACDGDAELVLEGLNQENPIDVNARNSEGLTLFLAAWLEMLNADDEEKAEDEKEAAEEAERLRHLRLEKEKEEKIKKEKQAQLDSIAGERAAAGLPPEEPEPGAGPSLDASPSPSLGARPQTSSGFLGRAAQRLASIGALPGLAPRPRIGSLAEAPPAPRQSILGQSLRRATSFSSHMATKAAAAVHLGELNDKLKPKAKAKGKAKGKKKKGKKQADGEDSDGDDDDENEEGMDAAEKEIRRKRKKRKANRRSGKLLRVVRMLVAKGADISMEDGRVENDGYNALHYAVARDNVLRTDWIMKKGLGIDSQASYGITPMMIAAGKGLHSMCVHLIRKGATLQAVDAEGDTPLHYAARSGGPGVTKTLLLAGADKLVPNRNELIPADLARLHHRAMSLEILLLFNHHQEPPRKYLDYLLDVSEDYLRRVDAENEETLRRARGEFEDERQSVRSRISNFFNRSGNNNNNNNNNPPSRGQNRRGARGTAR